MSKSVPSYPVLPYLGYLLLYRINSLRVGKQMADSDHLCETPGCEKPSKLRCPVCVKRGIEGSFFCSQVRIVSSFPVTS